MAAGKYNFILEQGVTFKRTITWQDQTGANVNLTGASAVLEIRDSLNNLILGLNQTPSSNGDVVTLGGAAGTFSITISATTTAALKFGNGRWELRVTDSLGTVTRLLQGSVTFSSEVL